MSKYTTEVRYICETSAGLDESVGYLNVNDVLDRSWNKVFDFPFPIYDVSYRSVLCKKILKHYYTREIGEETVGLWKLRLDARLNEIMPYYNQLYESALIKFNPMFDTDLTRDWKKETEGAKEGSNLGNETGSTAKNIVSVTDSDMTDSETTTFNDTMTHEGEDTKAGNSTTEHDANNVNWNVYSDTPQGALTRVADETYLTDARKVTDVIDDETRNQFIENGTNGYTDAHTGTIGVEGEGTEDTTVTTNESINDSINRSGSFDENFNTTDDYLEHLVGKSSGASYSKLLMEFRDTFLNIDLMIINNLSDLFMNIW